MALSNQEAQELAELEELDALEQRYGQQSGPKAPAQMSIDEANAADAQIQSEQDDQKLNALMSGAAQGSTFGFSDELGAGVDVALGKGDNKASLADRWRQLQKQRESANTALEEQHPGYYMGGELAGGVASAALMPSLGGAKLVGAAGKLSPRLAAFLAARAPASTAVKLAGKGAAGVIEGAPIGALYGLGSSENDMSRPTELAGDVVSGAGMGSLTGLGLNVASQTGKMALNKAKGFVDDTDFLRQLQSAYEYGEKGLNLGSSKVQDKISMVPGERAKQLVDKIMATDQELGQNVGNAISNAQTSGIKINVDPQLQATGSKIFSTLFVENPTLGQVLDPKSAKLLKTIAQREMGDLTPIEAKALRDELYGLSDKLAGFNSDQAHFAKKVGNELATALDQSLKGNIPEYKLAAQQFESFRRLVPENIMSQGAPSDLNKVYMGSLKNPELKLYESSKDMLKKAKLPGEAAAEQRATFEKLRLNLDELEKKNPVAMKKMGGSSEQVANSLRKDADELAMIRQAQGFDPQEGVKGIFGGALSGLVTTGRGISMTASNKAGLVAKGVGQSEPVKMSTKLFKAGNDQLMNLATKLKNSGSHSPLGDALENALMNKNEVAKNAVLFKLMQIPEYRNMLRSEGLGENNE